VAETNDSPVGAQPSYFEIVGNQRAYRELKSDPVPQELIERILVAGTHAPSARNSQPWHFVVVQDPEVRKQIADGTRAAWEGFARDTSTDKTTKGFTAVDRWASAGLGQAPVIIVLCGDTQRLPLDQMGSSIYPAAQNILLAAAALGLGSLMSNLPIFAPGGAFAKALELPEHIVPLAVLPIGYPARKLGKPRREPIATRTSRDRFGTPW
jgi:nitroreductase